MLQKTAKSLILSGKQMPAVLVIGDLMVDRYIWGQASRLSPEAPVPVLNANKETASLGGAANVARNLFTLHARVSLSGVIGADDSGSLILEQLSQDGIDTDLIQVDARRPTTQKTRIMAGNHQLLRVDKEDTANMPRSLETQMIRLLEPKIAASDMVLLSDYNKGVCTPSFTQAIIQCCRRFKKKILVDPKGLHYEKYQGAYLIKPNRRELAEAVVMEGVATDKELTLAARKLITTIKCNYLVVTKSEEGLALFSKKEFQNFPVKANEVFDVTGAGDTVFASLGYFLAIGLDIQTACELANYAAAVAVSKVGSVAVTLEEMLAIIPRKK